MTTSNLESVIGFVGRTAAAVVATTLLAWISGFAISPAVAQSSECDCSCGAYTKLMQTVKEFEDQQDSDTPQSIPPEMMQMSMCAGQCAMKWAQCQNPDLDMSSMQDAQKRAMQAHDRDSGEDAIARERGIHERAIGETEKNAEATGLSKDQLTGDYLQGTWCSVYGGQERTQWNFQRDGGYQIGMPAGDGWAMQRGGDNLDHYRDRFEKLIAMDDDSFVTEHRHGRKNVFQRGACQ